MVLQCDPSGCCAVIITDKVSQVGHSDGRNRTVCGRAVDPAVAPATLLADSATMIEATTMEASRAAPTIHPCVEIDGSLL